MIQPANRPHIPQRPNADALTRSLGAHAALVPGWTEMAVWQPEGPTEAPRGARKARWLAWLLGPRSR